MSDLLPCPHCGKSDALSKHYDGHLWFVLCNYESGGCGAQGGRRKTAEDAEDAWNTRAAYVNGETCKLEHVKHGPMGDLYRCDACGFEVFQRRDCDWIDFIYCPNCGRKAVDE